MTVNNPAKSPERRAKEGQPSTLAKIRQLNVAKRKYPTTISQYWLKESLTKKGDVSKTQGVSIAQSVLVSLLRATNNNPVVKNVKIKDVRTGISVVGSFVKIHPQTIISGKSKG